MSETHYPTTKTTLAEALASDDPAGDSAMRGIDDFYFTRDERERTSALWLHLIGVETSSSLAAVAGIECLDNPDLFVMLNAPAREFVDWFRRDDWEFYNLTEATGCETWARVALERALCMCAAMGELALQAPLQVPEVA